MTTADMTRRIGAGLVDLRGAASRRTVMIITYHGIREDDSPVRNWMLLPQSQFALQLDEIRKRFNVLALDDAVARLQADELDAPTACITFDDGYANNLSLALPPMRDRGIPATIFLPTAFIGSTDVPWTTALDAAFEAKPSGRVDGSIMGLGILSYNSIEQARAVGSTIKNLLKDLETNRRDEVLESLRTQLPTPSPDYLSAFRFLTWDEVRAMERGGLVSFGAHTVHHEIVARLSPERMRREITESVARVAAECVRPSRGFAYPNGRAGDFDIHAEEAVQMAGCQFAVSTIDGFNTVSSPRFALRRLSVGGDCDRAGFRRLTSRMRSAALAVTQVANAWRVR